MSAEHIAIMLELELSAVAECAGQKTTKGIPTGPPRRSLAKPAAIHGPNGAHVRTLRSLGYDALAIARVLDVELAAVVDFLRRIVPIRRAALVRPRGRTEHARIRPPRPRPDPPAPPPPIDPAEAWRYADGKAPYDRPMATIAPAADVVADLVDAELAPVEAPPSGDPWTGPTTLKATGEEHGNAKLTWPLVREVRRQHAAGWSCYRLAKQLGVNAGTIRCIVKNLTWVEDYSPTLPAPDALSDADCGKTVQNTGENGPS